MLSIRFIQLLLWGCRLRNVFCFKCLHLDSTNHALPCCQELSISRLLAGPHPFAKGHVGEGGLPLSKGIAGRLELPAVRVRTVLPRPPWAESFWGACTIPVRLEMGNWISSYGSGSKPARKHWWTMSASPFRHILRDFATSGGGAARRSGWWTEPRPSLWDQGVGLFSQLGSAGLVGFGEERPGGIVIRPQYIITYDCTYPFHGVALPCLDELGLQLSSF